MIPITTLQRTGLFDILGRLWYAAQERLDHLATQQEALTAAAQAITTTLAQPPELQAEKIASQTLTETRLADTTLAGLLSLGQRLIQEAVRVDTGRLLTIQQATEEAVRQFRCQGYYVSSPTVSVSVQPNSANQGDAILYVQELAEDGYPGASWVPQTGKVLVQKDQVHFSAPDDVSPLDSTWPKGSGLTGLLRPIALSEGYLTHGDLQPANSQLPGWTILGSSYQSISPPKDELILSVAPTGGYFRLAYTNRSLQTRLSSDIAYNVSASTLQQIIRGLDPELDRAECEVSVRANNLGWQLFWRKAWADLSLLQVYSYLEGATLSIQRTQSGTAGAYAGYALKLIGDGTEKTGLYQRVQVARPQATGLAVVRVWRHAGCTDGTLQLGLFQAASETASAVLTPAGEDNLLSVPLDTLPEEEFSVLLCPMAWTPPLDGYFGIRFSEPPSSGHVMLNWPQFIPVSAPSFWQPGLVLLNERFGPRELDAWTFTISNDLAGQVLTWWLRMFPQMNLSLPRTGTTLIPDTILAS